MPADIDGTRPEQRVIEQSMRLPTQGAVTGWAACRLHGANFFDGLDRDGVTPIDVPLAVGEHTRLRSLPGSTLLRDRLTPDEILVLHGVAVVRRVRAVFDAARRASDVREAVVVLEMMAAARLVPLAWVREYAVSRRGWRGLPQLRAALGLAREDSRSPNEPRTRLVWELDAGFPRPLVNREIFDDRGRLLGIADLFDPVAGVVGEYDGAEHRRARRHSRDVRREDLMRRANLEYFRVTGPDLADRPQLVERMRHTRARGMARDRSRDRWTLQYPPDWEPRLSLADKLALRELWHTPV